MNANCRRVGKPCECIVPKRARVLDSDSYPLGVLEIRVWAYCERCGGDLPAAPVTDAELFAIANE